MEALSHDLDSTRVTDSTDSKTTPRPPSLAERPPQHPESCIPPEQSDYPLEHGQAPAYENGYNSSASSTQHSSSDILGGGLDDDELAHLNSRASSRSSVSSIPASVLIHPPDRIKPSVATGTSDPFARAWDGNGYAGYGREGPWNSAHTLRQREGAFRKPSSVRAMQMHTEDEDDDYLTPPRRRGGQRNSDISMRSAGSPLKRSPYYSPNGSGTKHKVKKEFPLVLLHCNLLPPSLPVPNGIGFPSQKLLREILPPQYWRRWRLLEEKVGSGVLRDRGVLISHPQDMYDLLEERLLESLELQRPRLHKGHFLGHEETDSEKEDSSSKESGTDDEQCEQCPDCGRRVIRGTHSDRKWELKVFAANGLMRAGAWAAAWKEMEKVDVEVGLWLPPEVRTELEKRLLEEEQSVLGDGLYTPENESENGRRKSSMSFYSEAARDFVQEPKDQGVEQQQRPEPDTSTHNQRPLQEVDLPTLLINYVRVLASDRRNIAISILSIGVVLFAIGNTGRPPSSDLRPFPQGMFDPTPAASTIITQQLTDPVVLQSSLGLTREPSETSVATSIEITESISPSTAETTPEETPMATSTESTEPVSPTSTGMASEDTLEADTEQTELPNEPVDSTSEPAYPLESQVTAPGVSSAEEDSGDPDVENDDV